MKAFANLSLIKYRSKHIHKADTKNYQGVSKLWPMGHMQPRMARNAAQHKIVNSLKTLWDFFVIKCRNVFNVWPKTTLLLPVWHRDAKRLDTPAYYLIINVIGLYTYQLGESMNYFNNQLRDKEAKEACW